MKNLRILFIVVLLLGFLFDTSSCAVSAPHARADYMIWYRSPAKQHHPVKKQQWKQSNKRVNKFR
jgi:hypothetical protein